MLPQPQGLSSRRRLRGGDHIAVKVGPHGQFEALAERSGKAGTTGSSNRWLIGRMRSKKQTARQTDKTQEKTSSDASALDSTCARLLSHDDVKASGQPFANVYWGHLKRLCPDNEAMVSVMSTPNAKFGDRMWMVSCAPLKGHGVFVSSCEWTEYSTFRKPFNLPANRELAVITGVEGHYDFVTHDRRFRFRYCNVGGVRLHRTRNDPSWRNTLHGYFTLEEPTSEWLTTWESTFIFAGKRSDRLFSFQHAKFCLNPIACQLSSWTSFSECSKPCGGGSHVRTREISTKAHNGGACSPLKEEKKCNAQSCPIDCQVGAWTQFSECSQTCGSGHHVRKRKVNVAAAHGGNACPKLKEVQDCNGGDCPKEEEDQLINVKFVAGGALGVLVVVSCLVRVLRNPKGKEEEKGKEGKRKRKKAAFGDL